MAIYNGKHVVFEQVGVDTASYIWNSQSNTDSDGCSNNYEISDIRNTLAITILPKLSDELTNELVSTTVQTAKNGNSATLVSTTDKLFLSAGKEIGYTTYTVSEENNALTTWQYWTSHITNTAHIKYENSTARKWWLRSPKKDTSGSSYSVSTSGFQTDNLSYSSSHVSSCFAW